MTMIAPMLGARARFSKSNPDKVFEAFLTPNGETRAAERREFDHECSTECSDFVSMLLGTDEPVDDVLADVDAADYLGAAEDWLSDTLVKDEPKDFMDEFDVTAAEVEARVVAEDTAFDLAGSDQSSNFLAHAGNSAYNVESEGWTGWHVTTRP